MWGTHLGQSRQWGVGFRWLLSRRTRHDTFLGDTVSCSVFKGFANCFLTADAVVDACDGYVGIDFYEIGCGFGSRLDGRENLFIKLMNLQITPEKL